ncbi:MAG: VWA domain-containing protein [Candidatus Omnitrophica bacterium]|nr:VWA domain-containing protein [Candidatus Omnitrophota bacterium]
MFDIKNITVKRDAPSRSQMTQGYFEKIKFQNPGSDKKTSKAKPLTEETIQMPDRIDLDRPLEGINDVPTELPEADANLLKPNIESAKRTVNRDATRELDLLEMASGADLAGEEVEVPEDFRQKMFAFTPEHLADPSGADALRRTDRGRLAQSNYEAIDELMQVALSVYRKPGEEEGFFKISVIPGRDAARLEVIPKEVIFLVDASLSIQERRLDQFIRGIEYAVMNLNSRDRFNIYTFKDRITSLWPKPVTSSERAKEQAVAHLKRLKPSEQTDIYKAFLETIRIKPSQNPSYVIFLSDGRPTQGVVSSRKLIEEISRLNHRERSIFAFSGGVRVNRYLLDFLAYQNRGWSEYAERTFEVDDGVAQLYDKIRNPLLINVRYQTTGVSADEIYPKHLPDFYLNTEFVVYGRFREGSRLSMRVFGEVDGKVKEILFSRGFENAEPAGPEIARQWAFNKYYHLISSMTLEGSSPALKVEIAGLSRAYGIESPYDFGSGEDS